MQHGAGFGQGAVRDQNPGAAKAQQHAQERGQWQLARAGKDTGILRIADYLGKGQAAQ